MPSLWSLRQEAERLAGTNSDTAIGELAEIIRELCKHVEEIEKRAKRE